MPRTQVRGRHVDAAHDRSTRSERVLRRIWITATFLAYWVGVLVVPIQFVNAHHSALAQEIERSGATPYPVVDVRQQVESSRGGNYRVAAQVAEYRSGGATVSVPLRGYDSSAVVIEREGWFVVPGGSGDQVYVTEDGRSGFLAADYRSALRGEFDGLFGVANVWMGGWILVALAALVAVAASRVRRGAADQWRALRAPALYCLVTAASVAAAYGVSFPLAVK